MDNRCKVWIVTSRDRVEPADLFGFRVAVGVSAADEPEHGGGVGRGRGLGCSTAAGDHTTRPLFSGGQRLMSQGFDFLRQPFNALVQSTPIAASSSIIRNMRGDRTSERVARMIGSSARKKRSPWRKATPRSNKKARDLIDDAGALADQFTPFRSVARRAYSEPWCITSKL